MSLRVAEIDLTNKQSIVQRFVKAVELKGKGFGPQHPSGIHPWHHVGQKVGGKSGSLGDRPLINMPLDLRMYGKSYVKKAGFSEW
jgi:hypothetical protein